MGTATQISLEEYLGQSYDPDCEFLEGELKERNVGEFDHSDLQGSLYFFFRQHQKLLGLRALVEQRVRVKAERYRVPDLCLVGLERPQDGVVSVAPELVVEVLSPDDRMVDVEEKIADYLEMGVGEVWVVNPRKAHGWSFTKGGSVESREGVMEFRGLRVDLRAVREG